VELDATGLRTFLHEQATAVSVPASIGTSGGQFGNLGGQFGISGGIAGGFGPVFVGPPQPVQYVVRRLPTQAMPGPMALSADERTLVVANVLADSLTVIDCRPEPHVVKHVSLGGPSPDAKRRGEMLFHSARLEAGGRFTCASCHPGGGTDGAPWHMPAGGPGPRVPKDLHGVRETAPYGWHGEDATLPEHVTKTLETLFRHRPTRHEVSDLVAYLKSLPPPEPLQPAADAVDMFVAGRGLFEGKAGCVRCHAGSTREDGGRHDVGTGGNLDTPSLRGVGRRAPLLHDGRARSVEDVFQRHNADKRHGAADGLSKEEMSSLMVFLKSL
jgi:hypothetical protein